MADTDDFVSQLIKQGVAGQPTTLQAAPQATPSAAPGEDDLVSQMLKHGATGQQSVEPPKPPPKDTGVWKNLAASTESAAAGIIGLPGDLIEAGAKGAAPMAAAAEQGLKPAPGAYPDDYGVTHTFVNEKGALVEPDTSKIDTTPVIPPIFGWDGGAITSKGVERGITHLTGIDPNNVEPRSLTTPGGWADWGARAAPYILQSVLPGGVGKVAPSAASLGARVLVQAGKSAADAGLTAAVTTPGDVGERAETGALGAAVGGLTGAVVTPIGSAVKRLFGSSVRIGPDVAADMSAADAKKAALMSVSPQQAFEAADALKEKIGPNATTALQSLPKEDPLVPGYTPSLAQAVPNDVAGIKQPGAVMVERGARTKAPAAYDTLSDNQTAALRSANADVSKGADAGNIGDRLSNIPPAELTNAPEVAAASNTLNDSVSSLNSAVQRLRSTTKENLLTANKDGSYDVEGWRTANAEILKKRPGLTGMLDNVDKNQQSLTGTVQNGQTDRASLSLFQSGDVTGAADNIFAPATVKDGGVVNDSWTKMRALLDHLQNPKADIATTRLVQAPGGPQLVKLPAPSEGQARDGVKRMITDYVANHYLATPLSATGTAPADAAQASAFAKFVTDHANALREGLGADGFDVVQAVSDRMTAKTNVPASLGAKIDSKPEKAGILHSLASNSMGPVGVIVLDRVVDSLASHAASLLHAGGAIAQTGLIGGGAALAGAGAKIIYSAMRKAHIESEAQLIDLAVRYPTSIGKQLLSAAPSTMPERTARVLARSIGAAVAQDEATNPVTMQGNQQRSMDQNR